MQLQGTMMSPRDKDRSRTLSDRLEVITRRLFALAEEVNALAEDIRDAEDPAREEDPDPLTCGRCGREGVECECNELPRPCERCGVAEADQFYRGRFCPDCVVHAMNERD